MLLTFTVGMQNITARLPVEIPAYLSRFLIL